MASTYLVSPAGHPNFGDELIASAWLQHLARTQPETEVWLDCPNPGLASELFHGIHPRLHVTNTLWRACWEAPSREPAVVMERVTDLVRNYGSPAYDLGLDRLRRVDVIHFLGGGYLNDLWSFNAGLVAGALAARSLTGVKVVGTGLSVVPVLDGETEGDAPGGGFVDLLRQFDHVSVRDEPSAQALDVQLGLDDAFLGVEEQRERGLARGGADLVICLQSDLQSEEQSARVIAGVRETIVQARAEGRTVQYVEAIPGVDWPAFDALRDLIEPDDFIPFMSVWRDGLPLRSDQTWLTTRFHLHFLAAAAGAAGTAIGIRDGFYDVKHQSLIDLGSQWSYRSAAAGSGAGSGAGSPAHSPDGTPFTRGLDARIARKREEAELLYPSARVTDTRADAPARLLPSRLARGLRSVVGRDQRQGA